MSNEKKSFLRRWLWLIVTIIIITIIAVTIAYFPAVWLNIWLIVEPWLWLIISVVIVLIIYKSIIFAINRYVRRHKKFPHDATNGLILIVRIITIFAILFIVLPVLHIPSEYLIDFSTILATAIGFASTIAVSNIVAGIYMILSRPYRVGDFISIEGGVEGIVKEIGLNFTKIKDGDRTTYQIPNNKIFSSNITNFNLEPAKKVKDKKKMSLESKLISKFSEILIEENIIRYIFDTELSLDLNTKGTTETLEQICDRWEEKLGYRPQYYFHDIAARVTIRWALIADTPELIMANISEFLEDVWISAYKLAKEGQQQ